MPPPEVVSTIVNFEYLVTHYEKKPAFVSMDYDKSTSSILILNFGIIY